LCWMEAEEEHHQRNQDSAGQRRVLDEATRQRRLSRQLEALEKDNFQDDPLSSLPPPGPAARLPAFKKKKRKTRGDHFKQRFRKNFTTLLEEENLSEKPEPNYLSAAAPPSSLPPRHFCCVCGFPSHYTCTTCGGRYCCSRCLSTHRETRYAHPCLPKDREADPVSLFCVLLSSVLFCPLCLCRCLKWTL
uniref:Zinc finger, HIT-type containing 1 n=1 Tax=Seriola lalandi dorsalis TaxID=1841481 RepID=A0A3B4YMX6_SERLL